jgi:hypothetical protein
MKEGRHSSKKRQRGAIAVITGLMAVILVTFMGLAVDLGHLYVGTSELQNTADAAALAGAKELNQTAAGVTAAVDRVIAIAAQHRYNFSTPVNITAANIRLGSCPNADNVNTFGRPSARARSCTFVPASSVTTNAAAATLTFLEVDTGTQTFDTYFMRVAGAAFDTTSTAGYAVAGRFVNNISPLGVCAIDPAHRTTRYTYPNGATELVEHGFRRGVTYNLFGLNPLAGGPSDPYLINPVDTSATGCTPSHSSAAFTAPFMCTGGSAVLASGTGQVYTNTGLTASLAASLNSRFDDYSGPSVCDPVTAPPDANVKQYRCRNPSSDPDCINNAANNPSVTPPIDWMQPGANTLPNVEYVATSNATHRPFYSLPPTLPNLAFNQYGVLWSYGPAYHATAAATPAAAAPFTPTEANATVMYNTTAGGPLAYFDTSRYPASSPYSQTAGDYFLAPPTHPPGIRNRRVLNVVLIDCTTPPVGSASCGRMTAVGIGRFFMQVPAVLTGGNKRLIVEFAGLIQPIPSAEIKLYR